MGADFGAGCTINPRGSFSGPGATTWDDEAPTTLAGGAAPSFGVAELARRFNASHASKNGTFTLEIAKLSTTITPETLDRWTLEIWTVP